MSQFESSRSSASLEKHMAAYALVGVAGAGLLAVAPDAEAEVVYTPTHVVMEQGSTYDLDVNHDGVVDFIFSNIGSTFGFIQDFAVSPQGHLNAVVNEGFCISSNGFPRDAPAALASGVPIGKALKFAPYGECMRSDFYSDIQGHWQDVTNRYLGLALRIDGEVHYGWARLSTAGIRTFQAVLTGYAYETEPGKAIVAGDEGAGGDDAESVDPASETAGIGRSLGKLALGAAGVDQ
jgi:hypothetical protein